ncbi:MAG TPA: RidA family protein [Magnetospirillaceae bacterium]|jgi:enamine deaminase RidA (YjgF/YER057c/UK114 family)
MAGTCEARLTAMGITLPPAPAAVGAYVPFTRAGTLLFISGQLPLKDGKLVSTGLLGTDLTLEQGQQAARLAAINTLAQMKAAAGDLDNVVRVTRLVGYVACAPGFTDTHKVLNGASDLLAEVLGDAGRHARTAVGAAILPLNAPVEVELTAELKA